MKWIPRLFALGGIIALMIQAGLSYGRAIGRHASISSIVHQMQANCPQADAAEFTKQYSLISQHLKETEASFTDLVWLGVIVFGLSVIGFFVGAPERNDDGQQPDEPNAL